MISLDLVERPLGQHLAVVEHGDALGQRADHVHIVLDDQQRDLARQGLALVPQGRRIFSPLTVSENLTLGARPGEWTLERVHALFPRLGERALQPGGTLSGGEQQMLAIARALMTNGRMLVLDEPSEGLAPIVVREIGRIVRGLKGGRLSILLVEQNYHLALQVADRVYVMNKGQIVWEGTPAGLEADEDVKRRYLGVA